MKTDAEIQHDVMEELQWRPELHAAEIGVAVKDGIVTLSGTVDAFIKKRAAEKAAGSVKGVKAVAEDILVKVAGWGKKTDAEIAEAALAALQWNQPVKAEKIKLSVEDGWITLEGEADWQFEKTAASRSVEHVPGVMGVRNLVRIKPRMLAPDVKQQITAAFLRNANVDANQVEVEIKGHTVILKGQVRSWAEKRDAENVCWRIQGVENVENKLHVEPLVFAI